MTTLREAAQNVIDACGGNVPDWLRSDMAKLEDAIALQESYATPACEPHPDLITEALMQSLTLCDSADEFVTHMKTRHMETLERDIPNVRDLLNRALAEREDRTLNPSELAALGLSQQDIAETACCAWEAILNAKDDELIDAAFEALGTCEIRRFACFVAPMIEADWQSIGGGESYGDPFDWEFVPQWLALNVNWCGESPVVNAARVMPNDKREWDDGCPKGDPECLGNNGDCHDACEAPEPCDACGKLPGEIMPNACLVCS